ncbi:hypothetical protein Lal_00011380 [Lupinus albus]|nr:hypothetical protein Lal_00011380 [Lupinus albus]
MRSGLWRREERIQQCSVLLFSLVENVRLESGLFYCYLLIYLYNFDFLPSFLKSHGFDPVESDPFSH